MKSKFKLIGISRPKSITCIVGEEEHMFRPQVRLSDEKFEVLWDYCMNSWADEMFVEIEHEGLNENGTPINPVVVGFVEKTKTVDDSYSRTPQTKFLA